MIVNWDFFIKRKRLDVKKWLHDKNIKNYSELLAVTERLGIEAPNEEVVARHFIDKKEKAKTDEPVKTKASTRKSKQPSKELSEEIKTDTDDRTEYDKPKRKRRKKPNKAKQSENK